MPPNTHAAAAAHDALRATSSRAGPETQPAAAGAGKFTWQEVAKHNTAESAWVIIDDGVYDVTPFLDKHPGGREMLLLAAGRDCSNLFESYHWWDGAKAARSKMADYRIGALSGPTELPRYKPDTKGFYATLSKRVRAHFEARSSSPAAAKAYTKSPVAGLWRLALITAVFGACYAFVNGRILPLDSVPWALQLAVAALFGVFQAMPLLHAMHDASHAAIGTSEGWWKGVGRFCLDGMAGGSMISWHHQHIIGHHLYTNVFNADPDIPFTPTGDPRFLSERTQVFSSPYRWQWLYLPVLYGLLGFSTRVNDVLATWVAQMSGPVRVNYYDSAAVRVFGVKALWASWRIGVPLLLWGVPASTFWPLFLVTEMATGFYLAWNFEVSHVADTVDWPVPEKVAPASGSGEQLVVPLTWAEAQAATSVDYGHNWWATFFSGALNYQIEHHLFPGISQYHYPAIAGIVEATCKEFGVRYQNEPSFWAAWTAHVRQLYVMGQRGVAKKLD